MSGRVTTLCFMLMTVLAGCRERVIASGLEPGARVAGASGGLVYLLAPDADGSSCMLSRVYVAFAEREEALDAVKLDADASRAREPLMRVRTCDAQDLAFEGPAFWRIGNAAIVRHQPPERAHVVFSAPLLTGLALVGDNLYVADCGQDSSCAITRMNRRGESPTRLQTGGITTVRQLAADGTAIYWLDGGHRRRERSARTLPLLVRAPLAPHSKETVLDVDFNGDSFVVAGGHIYWHADGALRRMASTGGAATVVLAASKLTAAATWGSRLVVAADGAIYVVDEGGGVKEVKKGETRGIAIDGDSAFFVDDATSRLLEVRLL